MQWMPQSCTLCEVHVSEKVDAVDLLLCVTGSCH